MRYTYSRWTQGGGEEALPADAVMAALADDLLADDSVATAVARLQRRGLQSANGESVPGMHSLREALRAQRRQELERYDLQSMMDDIREQVESVLDAEREALTRHGADDLTGDVQREALQAVTERKRHALEAMERDPAGAIPALADYEFLDGMARTRFDALLEMLQRHVLQKHFAGMEQAIGGLAGAGTTDLKAMLSELNEILQERMDGREGAVGAFLERHGAHFPGAQSLEDVVGQITDQASHTETLMASMSPQMRRELEQVLAPVLKDRHLQDQLSRMAESIALLFPPRPQQREYPFSGSQSVTLDEALQLMRRMHRLDLLEAQFEQWEHSDDPAQVRAEDVAGALGDAAGGAVAAWQHVTDVLSEAGYVQSGPEGYELTARGVRLIGRQALLDIFNDLDLAASGSHHVSRTGDGVDRADESKTYQWGDALHLDLPRSVMHAVYRRGGGTPVRLQADDFDVYCTERNTRASTVLMLDMSRSMPLRGCFAAARRVALALSSLVRTQFPRDELYIVGFADFARQLQPEALHGVTWDEQVYGTNMQHGFMVARRLLGRRRENNRQIILITDGEPTAHFEDDAIQFAYPPTARTFEETLREVHRCTREGITINTFMLDRSQYLTEFVAQMTRINRGRAFYARPERLGAYVLVDYVRLRRGQG